MDWKGIFFTPVHGFVALDAPSRMVMFVPPNPNGIATDHASTPTFLRDPSAGHQLVAPGHLDLPPFGSHSFPPM